MALLQVLHLVGSPVSEFYADLSRLYAQDCWKNTANADRYEFHIAYVSPPEGESNQPQWRFPASLARSAIAAAKPQSLGSALQTISDRAIDIVVPQMFCVPGMTTYRALFDLLGIPYVGNTAAVMALVADKVKTKAIVAAAGVVVPAGSILRSGDRPALNFPVIIKPISADNSLGVTLVKSMAEFDAALPIALAHDDGALVEQFIPLGREVRCGIIVKDGELVCLPLEEYALNPDTTPIRGYAEKLKQNAQGELDFAAKESTHSWIVDSTDPITADVWAMAKKCHVALGCRHYSLFDFRIDPAGNPWFLEAGLYCSFAETSVLSAMAKAAGIELDEFFQSMLQIALCQVK
jgi:D-alanine-D-alanine ligase